MSESSGEPAPARPAKSASAYRTIGEVADDLDLPAHVLRFWESKFPQLKPLKRGGGRRYYRPEDIALLRRIRQCLYQDGYTIRGVQKLLGDPVDNDTATGAAAMPTLFPLDGAAEAADTAQEPSPPEDVAAATPAPAKPRRPRRQRRTAEPKEARAEAETATTAVPEASVVAEAEAADSDQRWRAALEDIRRDLTEARALLAELLQPKPPQ